MPTPGFLDKQITIQEALPRTGTIGPYEGTIVGPGIGTVVGGVVIRANALTQLERISLQEIGGLGGGTITAARILGFGKKLGTLAGSFIGTIVADSNQFLMQVFVTTFSATLVGSVMAPAQPPVGALITGSVQVEEAGV